MTYRSIYTLGLIGGLTLLQFSCKNDKADEVLVGSTVKCIMNEVTDKNGIITRIQYDSSGRAVEGQIENNNLSMKERYSKIEFSYGKSTISYKVIDVNHKEVASAEAIIGSNGYPSKVYKFKYIFPTNEYDTSYYDYDEEGYKIYEKHNRTIYDNQTKYTVAYGYYKAWKVSDGNYVEMTSGALPLDPDVNPTRYTYEYFTEVENKSGLHPDGSTYFLAPDAIPLLVLGKAPKNLVKKVSSSINGYAEYIYTYNDHGYVEDVIKLQNNWLREVLFHMTYKCD